MRGGGEDELAGMVTVGDQIVGRGGLSQRESFEGRSLRTARVSRLSGMIFMPLRFVATMRWFRLSVTGSLHVSVPSSSC